MFYQKREPNCPKDILRSKRWVYACHGVLKAHAGRRKEKNNENGKVAMKSPEHKLKIEIQNKCVVNKT